MKAKTKKQKKEKKTMKKTTECKVCKKVISFEKCTDNLYRFEGYGSFKDHKDFGMCYSCRCDCNTAEAKYHECQQKAQEKAAEVIFKQIDAELAEALYTASKVVKLGGTVKFNDEGYKFNYASGSSVYFEHKQSIIRVSNHWSINKYKNHDWGCGWIRDQFWTLKSTNGDKSFIVGMFQSAVESVEDTHFWGGIASKKKLNVNCEHFRTA